MATLCLPAHTPVHQHAARRLHFSASSDGLLLWLSEECWCRGLIRLAALLDDLLTERQAEQLRLRWMQRLRSCCRSEAGATAAMWRQTGCSTGLIGSRVSIVLVSLIWE